VRFKLLIYYVCVFLINNRLVVSQNGRALHIVFPHQFLDSPEWFGVSTDEYFQVKRNVVTSNALLPQSVLEREEPSGMLYSSIKHINLSCKLLKTNFLQ